MGMGMDEYAQEVARSKFVLSPPGAELNIQICIITYSMGIKSVYIQSLSYSTRSLILSDCRYLIAHSGNVFDTVHHNL